jgi:hypothetical protein
MELRDRRSSGYSVLGIMDEDPWDVGKECIASVERVKCSRLSVRLLATRKQRLKNGHSSFVILSNEVTTFVDGRSSG